jgi:adenylate cyclase
MKKTLLLIVMLCNTCVFAQKQGQPKIDSLLLVLKTTTTDSTKVNTLNALAEDFINKKPDTAIYFANEAHELATRMKYQMGIANACLNIGIALKNLGNYKKALKSSNDALLIYDQLLPLSTGTEKTGSKYRILKQKALTLKNIGVIYGSQGNYPEGSKYSISSLKISEEIGDKYGMGRTSGNIGYAYFLQGNYPEALKYTLASLKIKEEIGDKIGIVLCHNNIGLIYEGQHDYAEALKNHIVSLKISQEIGYKEGIATSYNNIGIIYKDQGNYPEALKNYLASVKISEEIGHKEDVAASYNNIGMVYMKQKKYKDASQYLNNGLSLAKEIGSLECIKTSYSGLAELDSAQGNFIKSLEHYKKYTATRDSILRFDYENASKMMQYEFDKKEALAKADQENKDALVLKELQRQKLVRNGFIGGFAVMLLFAAIFFSQRNKIKKGKNRSDELLLNILPVEVAEELKQTGRCQAKTFSMVTVMFTDFKDFTNVSENVSAELLVDEINFCFSAFDHIIQKYKIEKIKTVGDAYICVSGLPLLNYTHAFDMVSAAIEIRDFMLNRIKEKEAKGELPFELRIGIHTGPVVAGIVGVKKFQYDIWGDTVNLAARMENSGEAGQVNISGTTHALVKDRYNCVHRGKIVAKHKGEIDMYFVEPVNAFPSSTYSDPVGFYR